jgi:hypothetical protein
VIGARLGKQIAAEEGGRSLLEQIAAIPSVGQVGCVDPRYRVPAERECFAVTETECLAVGDVIDGHHLRHGTAERYSTRRHLEEFIDGAAFVGLEMRDAEIAQAACRYHRLDRLADQWEHPARPGVEQQRFVVGN